MRHKGKYWLQWGDPERRLATMAVDREVSRTSRIKQVVLVIAVAGLTFLTVSALFEAEAIRDAFDHLSHSLARLLARSL